MRYRTLLFTPPERGSQKCVAKAAFAPGYSAGHKVWFHRLILSPSARGTNGIVQPLLSADSGVVGQVELAEEFRTRAQRCLKLAHEAPTLEAQTHWLAMAQLWFGLAQHAEEQDAMFLSNSPSRLGTPKQDDENGHSDGEGEGNGGGNQ